MANAFEFWSAERIAEVSQCPVEAVRENWPLLVEQLVHAGINERAVQVAVIANVAHETASTFRPVAEAYYLGDRAEAYRKTLKYYPYYGRGFLQNTHEDAYRDLGPKIAALWNTSPDQPDFDLIGNPDNLLNPALSAAACAIFFRDKAGGALLAAARRGDLAEVRRLVWGANPLNYAIGTPGRNAYERTVRIANALAAAPSPTTDPRYVFPVEGYPAGPIALHWNVSPNAADLFAERGTPVRAMVNGTVRDASFNSLGGWSVYMVGDPDTKSLHYYLAHLNEIPPVTAGQRVEAGQTIGSVGDSGNAAGKGTHLHIGIGSDIKDGSGAEGGAGVPWPGNNANKYLQKVLDVFGSAPIVATPEPQPEPEPPPPPPLPPAPAQLTLSEVKAALIEMMKPSDQEIVGRVFREKVAALVERMP